MFQSTGGSQVINSYKLQVFVPTYHGDDMEMVRLHSMSDYESLPLTKWHIKQPVYGDQKGRDNALETGKCTHFK